MHGRGGVQVCECCSERRIRGSPASINLSITNGDLVEWLLEHGPW